MFDLDQRLKQMHLALQSVVCDDLSSIQPVLTATENRVTVRWDCTNDADETSLENAATQLIAKIASLRDYLKVWCRHTGKQFNGETLINSNKSVALIHDLWNVDKHCELDKQPRSGHKPKIGKIQKALRLSTGATAGSGAVFTFCPRTGKTETHLNGGGNAHLILDADILDEYGNVIADFARTCEVAVEAWLAEMVVAGVVLATK